MGAAVVPLMIFSTIASTGVSLMQSSQQKSMMRDQAAAQQEMLRTQTQEQMNKIQIESKNEEMQRLAMMTDTINQNVIRVIAGGTTLEGTPGAIIESNIEDARQDVKTIQLNREQALSGLQLGSNQQSAGIEAGLSANESALNLGQVGAVVGGIGGVAGIEAQRQSGKL